MPKIMAKAKKVISAKKETKPTKTKAAADNALAPFEEWILPWQRFARSAAQLEVTMAAMSWSAAEVADRVAAATWRLLSSILSEEAGALMADVRHGEGAADIATKITKAERLLSDAAGLHRDGKFRVAAIKFAEACAALHEVERNLPGDIRITRREIVCRTPVRETAWFSSHLSRVAA